MICKITRTKVKVNLITMYNTLKYKYLIPNINIYPHMMNFFLDIWYWFLMCCKVIHILWITFGILML